MIIKLFYLPAGAGVVVVVVVVCKHSKILDLVNYKKMLIFFTVVVVVNLPLILSMSGTL